MTGFGWDFAAEVERIESIGCYWLFKKSYNRRIARLTSATKSWQTEKSLAGACEKEVSPACPTSN